MDETFQQERDRVLASLPSVVTQITGRIGNVLFTKQDGKTRVFPAPYPSSTGPAPEKVAQATKYRQLKANAERLLQDPMRGTYYERIAAKKGVSPFAVVFDELLRASVRREKRRAGARKEAREKRVAERRNRGRSHRSGFAAPQADAASPHRGIEEVLALIPSLTPAETEMLRAELQESLERIAEGLREQGAGI